MPESRIVFGTAALGLPYGLGRGGKPPSLMDEGKCSALLADARTCGVVTFDTAPAYGVSEERLGQSLGPHGEVWTKVGHDAKDGPIEGRIERSLATSLTRLRRDAVNLLQWHNWTAARADAEFRKDWARLASDPRVKALGATTYGPEDALAAVESGLFAVVQVEWNLLNQSVVRAIGKVAIERGVRIAVRSVLLQGVLSDDSRDVPPEPELIEGVARARALAKKFQLSLRELAFRAALSEPAISHVLVGADSVGQLGEAVAFAAMAPLSDSCRKELEALDLGGTRAADPRHWRR